MRKYRSSLELNTLRRDVTISSFSFALLVASSIAYTAVFLSIYLPTDGRYRRRH